MTDFRSKKVMAQRFRHVYTTHVFRSMLQSQASGYFYYQMARDMPTLTALPDSSFIEATVFVEDRDAAKSDMFFADKLRLLKTAELIDLTLWHHLKNKSYPVGIAIAFYSITVLGSSRTEYRVVWQLQTESYEKGVRVRPFRAIPFVVDARRQTELHEKDELVEQTRAVFIGAITGHFKNFALSFNFKGESTLVPGVSLETSAIILYGIAGVSSCKTPASLKSGDKPGLERIFPSASFTEWWPEKVPYTAIDHSLEGDDYKLHNERDVECNNDDDDSSDIDSNALFPDEVSGRGLLEWLVRLDLQRTCVFLALRVSMLMFNKRLCDISYLDAARYAWNEDILRPEDLGKQYEASRARARVAAQQKLPVPPSAEILANAAVIMTSATSESNGSHTAADTKATPSLHVLDSTQILQDLLVNTPLSADGK